RVGEVAVVGPVVRAGVAAVARAAATRAGAAAVARAAAPVRSPAMAVPAAARRGRMGADRAGAVRSRGERAAPVRAEAEAEPPPDRREAGLALAARHRRAADAAAARPARP